MRMQKKQFRIGELAKRLNVERFVIRFWEKEFNIRPTRSDGGQRFYQEKDFNTFKQIKKLLYENGFTISGARQQLTTKNPQTTVLGSHKTVIDNQKKPTTTVDHVYTQKLICLKKKLIQVKKYL